MPAPLFLQTVPAVAVAFTWVDGIKIVLIPLVLFVLQRVFTRRDKSTDEQRAKKEAEAKERERRIDNKLTELDTRSQGFVHEDKLNERFTHLEQRQSGHENRMLGFQQQHERFAEVADRRCQALENQVNQVPQLREDMAGMKAELKGYGKSLDEMKEMLRELLRGQK
ncbi:hypothetical protein [Hymenobacter cheonanensis]|uniref:hypothetical protein n=1 Tax=Hymenobacter sp. CA2-7 TaxID=3063993 RepID=UPI002712CF0C|nr:hypothetical protein [Hymenobacter sp. CA2-7]MDO7888241.1 hypothetical protein [Hymenobacter sp. CA2-7]